MVTPASRVPFSCDPQSYWHAVSTARIQRLPMLIRAKPYQAPGGLLHARSAQHALEARNTQPFSSSSASEHHRIEAKAASGRWLGPSGSRPDESAQCPC